jgi:hypothetical protein
MEKLSLRDFIHPVCNRVDLSCCSLRIEEAEEFVRKNCNNFLKTKQGFYYLTMKYPNLSVPQAINEYVKEALWIDSIV